MTGQIDSPDTFAHKLRSAGLSEKRSVVVARRVSGESTTEIASDLGISTAAVSQHYMQAIDQAEEGSELAHLLWFPDYLNPLPADAAKVIGNHADASVAFTLHLPVDTDAELSLSESGVIEAIRIDSTYRLTYYEPGHGRTDTPKYYTIEPEYVLDLLTDWLLPGRLWCPHHDDGWYLTDTFDVPSDAEDALADPDSKVEEVSVLLDDDFANPFNDPGVNVAMGGSTGVYPQGFRIAYTPTEDELAQAYNQGLISEDELLSTLHRREMSDSIIELIDEDK